MDQEKTWQRYDELIEHLLQAEILADKVGMISESGLITTLRVRITRDRDAMKRQFENWKAFNDRR